MDGLQALQPQEYRSCKPAYGGMKPSTAGNMIEQARPKCREKTVNGSGSH